MSRRKTDWALFRHCGGETLRGFLFPAAFPALIFCQSYTSLYPSFRLYDIKTLCEENVILMLNNVMNLFDTIYLFYIIKVGIAVRSSTPEACTWT